MDDDLVLTDFSLENIDFDFHFNEGSMLTQDHQMDLEFKKPKPMVKEMKKTKNTAKVISFDFSRNVTSNSSAKRSSDLAKEHVLAEKKRREKMNEKFIALSALLPDLKKLDKVTILENAISHMKQLQEDIKTLNEEKAREIGSMTLLKKSKVCFDEEEPYFLSSPSIHEKFDQDMPDIKVKMSENEVLIRIHCKKTKECMLNILNTIENLQLWIKSSFVFPFGDSNLDITILAQMEKDFSVSVLKDLVKNLKLAMI